MVENQYSVLVAEAVQLRAAATVTIKRWVRQGPRSGMALTESLDGGEHVVQ